MSHYDGEPPFWQRLIGAIVVLLLYATPFLVGVAIHEAFCS